MHSHQGQRSMRQNTQGAPKAGREEKWRKAGDGTCLAREQVSCRRQLRGHIGLDAQPASRLVTLQTPVGKDSSPRYKVRMSPELRPEVSQRRPRGNRFWFKAAAASFVIKLALLVVIFFAVHALFE